MQYARKSRINQTRKSIAPHLGHWSNTIDRIIVELEEVAKAHGHSLMAPALRSSTHSQCVVTTDFVAKKVDIDTMIGG
jgi:hypothetical protein